MYRNAVTRWIVRAIAVAGALLIAAPAATPARADDTLSRVLSAMNAAGLPASYGSNDAVDTSASADDQATPTAGQQDTATNTQTATATGGAGGTATGGNAQSSHGGSAYANGGNAEAHNSLTSEQSNQASGRSGYEGSGKSAGGEDVFVLETAKPRPSRGAGARKHDTSPAGPSGTAERRAVKRGLEHPRGDEAAKALPRDGVPGRGGELPGQNPFFSLLSGSGGSTAGLALLLLAVLGAAIALPRHHFKPLRTPAVTWRPSAYVPPIELPG